MSQIWVQTAAEYFNIPNVECYLGGTEATASNYRSLKAIQSVRFTVDKMDESENPVYHVQHSDLKDPLVCFSKKYNVSFNLQSNFAAIMTYSHDDENCPVVFGAENRYPIMYDDPKEFDGTDQEEEKYIERFEQIGVEMIFVFSQIINNFRCYEFLH